MASVSLYPFMVAANSRNTGLLKTLGAQDCKEKIDNKKQAYDQDDKISHILEPPAQTGIEDTHPEKNNSSQNIYYISHVCSSFSLVRACTLSDL